MEIRQTRQFASWFAGLRDRKAQDRIVVRIRRLELGHFGDAKQVGDGIGELRIDHGPGYRLYYARRGDLLVILLCGGDKGSQARDITKAKMIAAELEE